MKWITIYFAFIFSTGLNAKETVAATAGITIGAEGTTSYTIGQVVYSTSKGINGSVEEGVQQPYEILTITGMKETRIDLKMNVFPNPTTNQLQLTVESEFAKGLSCQLMDLQGRVIEDRKIEKIHTVISLETVPKAIYFLKVNRNNQVIKTFKIIKQ